METQQTEKLHRCEILTEAQVGVQAFWDVMLCHYVCGSWHSSGRTTYPVTVSHPRRLNLQWSLLMMERRLEISIDGMVLSGFQGIWKHRTE